MSSNPFRRSSFKDAPSSTGTGSASPSSRPDPSGAGTPVPLSVNTRVPSSSQQKHVEFASPPAVPIPPASYPSSPESTRQSPGFHAAFPATPTYGEAIQVDSFDQDGWAADEDDGAIEQAQQNARINTERASFKAVQRDAVKDTLSRFASGPNNKRSPANSGGQKETAKQEKQTIDVDAFTRLLLTGESTTTVTEQKTESTTQPASDSSSADTASLSQRSVLDAVAPGVEETPGSSIDQDRHAERTHVAEPRRRPPPPKSRYGKPTNDGAADATQTSAASSAPPSTEIADPSPSPALFGPPLPSASEVKRRPPTPPLARRKSQNKTATRAAPARNPLSRYSTNSSSDEPSSPSPLGLGKPAPPLPPPPPPPHSSMRRVNSHSSRRTSADLAATMEEEGDHEADQPIVAALDQTKSSSKRASMIPPPLPPPRRNRASSRSSVESQTPVPGPLRQTNSSRNSAELRRPAVGESRNASHAADILADLAALQREVDQARVQAGR